MSNASELFSALAKAQSEYPHIPKTREVRFQTRNGMMSYKYADLADINKAIAPINSKHGLAMSQLVDVENGIVMVQTVILHSSGESFETGVVSFQFQGDIKALGSTITYLRRYSLCSALNIVADDDDDGEASTQSYPDVKALIEFIRAHALTEERKDKIKSVWHLLTPQDQAIIKAEIDNKIGELNAAG